MKNEENPLYRILESVMGKNVIERQGTGELFTISKLYKMLITSVKYIKKQKPDICQKVYQNTLERLDSFFETKMLNVPKKSFEKTRLEVHLKGTLDVIDAVKDLKPNAQTRIAISNLLTILATVSSDKLPEYEKRITECQKDFADICVKKVATSSSNFSNTKGVL